MLARAGDDDDGGIKKLEERYLEHPSGVDFPNARELELAKNKPYLMIDNGRKVCIPLNSFHLYRASVPRELVGLVRTDAFADAVSAVADARKDATQCTFATMITVCVLTAFFPILCMRDCIEQSVFVGELNKRLDVQNKTHYNGRRVMSASADGIAFDLVELEALDGDGGGRGSVQTQEPQPLGSVDHDRLSLYNNMFIDVEVDQPQARTLGSPTGSGWVRGQPSLPSSSSSSSSSSLSGRRRGPEVVDVGCCSRGFGSDVHFMTYGEQVQQIIYPVKPENSGGTALYTNMYVDELGKAQTKSERKPLVRSEWGSMQSLERATARTEQSEETEKAHETGNSAKPACTLETFPKPRIPSPLLQSRRDPSPVPLARFGRMFVPTPSPPKRRVHTPSPIRHLRNAIANTHASADSKHVAMPSPPGEEAARQRPPSDEAKATPTRPPEEGKTGTPPASRPVSSAVVGPPSSQSPYRPKRFECADDIPHPSASGRSV